MTEKSTILLVGARGLPLALERQLNRSFSVETVGEGQVSGTLLISSAQAIVAAHPHMDEVARAIRSSSSDLELPCLLLAPESQLTLLKGRAPREITVVIGDKIEPSALAARLEAVIKKASTRKPRPRTLAGVGGLGPSQAAVSQAVAQAKQSPTPTETGAKTKLKRSRPSSASRIVPEDEWIRPSRPPPPPALKPSARPTSPPPVPKPSVGMPAAEVLSLRIALVDDDVTRADAISASLRKAGHTVFVAAGRAEHVRWSLLRQFSPQALIVQKATLQRDSGAWAQTISRDPFLRQTPLVTCYFSGLFNARTGTSQTAKLLPKLEGIGKGELEFSKALRSGTLAEVDREQINPGRLLALLTEIGKSVLITCTSESEILTWKLVAGVAGPAELKEGGRATSLTPPQALDKLLSRPDSKIVVQARSDLGAQKGHDVFELLEDAYRVRLPRVEEDDSAVIEDQEFITGAYKNAAEHIAEYSSDPSTTDGEIPDSEIPTAPVDVHKLPGVSQLLDPKDDSTVIHNTKPKMKIAAPVPVPQLADAAPDSVPPGSVPPVRPNEETTVVEHALPPAEEIPTGLRHAVVDGAGEGHAPAGSGLALKTALVAAGLLALGAAGYVVTRGGDSGEAAPPQAVNAATPGPSGSAAVTAASGKEPSTPAAPPPKTPPAEAPPEEEPSADDLWSVTPAEMDSCETVLGKTQDDFSGKPKWRADLAWKNARRKLMAGSPTAALKFMCEAAFMDPGGSATAGLAGFYLSKRALKEAHRWALLGAEADSRRSKELLGDVLNQMGKNEDAQAHWLETLKLAEDNTEKKEAVARSLVKNSKKVRKGGDSALAERLLRRAASLDGENAEAAAALAAVLLRNGQQRLASAWAQWALGLNPRENEALLTLGDLAIAEDRHDEARSYYEKISKNSVHYNKAKERMKKL